MRLIIFLFFPLISLCQKHCAGTIVDKVTGKGIPYATVGLIRENKGVSADEKGNFSINSFLPKTDSLRISSVGYEAQVLPVSGWVNGSVIMLQQAANSLKEVVVSNQQKQALTLNSFRRCSWNMLRTGLKAINQLAQLYTVPEQGMQLTELELCKDASESIFRIRIYDVDASTGGPSKDLADTVIEVRSKESHVNINLEEYNIIIPGKSFYVAIEWLFIPFNEQREETKRNGRKTEWTYYKPVIKFVENRNSNSMYPWKLGFNGKWTEMTYNQDVNYQITVKLR